MKTILPPFSGQNSRWFRAFSLVEILCVVVVIGLIAAVVVPSIGPVRTSATQTKLSSDVAVLNRAISLYVAEGGSVDNVANPLDVIERLKTKTSAADARRHVGPATGRFVDLRLSGKSVTTSTAASGQPRAVWDSTQKKFVLASQGDGIAEFYFDDSKATTAAKVETRTPSSMLYNGSNGWVWENAPGSSSTLAAMTPTTDSVPSSSGSPPSSSFTPSSPSTSLPSSLSTLPPPTITPGSGTFEAATFPATATINKNLAAGVGGRAVYMIIHSDNTYTPWTTYSSAFALAYGDTVLAYNQSTDAAHYVDSVQARQTYVREPKTLPAPVLTPPGGTYANASFPIGVTILANGAPGGAFSTLKYRVTTRSGVVGAWTNYSSPVSMKFSETLEAKNFGVDTTSYYDSPSVVGTYAPQVPITLVDAISGTVVPKWTDMVGKVNLLQTISNLLPNDVKATFGLGLLGSGPNSLSFQRVAWNDVPADTDFKIGTFSYYNGTVQLNTEATSINLHLDMALTKPGSKTGTADAHVSLWSSTNTGSAQASADYCQLDNPVTDFAFTVNGVTYTLQLKFANIAVEEGWTDGTRLYVYEGYNGHADLIARFVSSY